MLKKSTSFFSPRSEAQRTEAYASLLRSLQPCWTPFLNILRGVFLLSQTCGPVKCCRVLIALFPSLLVRRNTGPQPFDNGLILTIGQTIHPQAQPARQLSLIENLQDIQQVRMTFLWLRSPPTCYAHSNKPESSFRPKIIAEKLVHLLKREHG